MPAAPSRGQVDLPHFFGAAVPETSAAAHRAIEALLSAPGGEMRWREERARRMLARIPGAVAGQNGHNATLKVACVLVQGFDLPMGTARSLLAAWNATCAPPWSESELEHKLRHADKMAGLQTPEGMRPRGCLAGPQGGQRGQYRPPAAERAAAGGETETEARKKVVYEPETLARLARPWDGIVDLRWLANRSAVDPAMVSAKDFLRGLYKPGQKVLAFTDSRSQGEALWPGEALPTRGPQGVWFLAQPVTGEAVPNPRNEGKRSRRIAECCVEFPFLVLESDDAPVRAWLGFLAQAPLRIEALYTSGGRSVHALVRVGCRTKEAWDAEKAAMMPFLMAAMMCGADRGTWSAVRLTRLPGCVREEKKAMQKLLYYRPNADGRPLLEQPVVRDVEREWCERAARWSASQAPDWMERVERGLMYYERVSVRCAQALREMREKMEGGW